ncbi:insulinase family protein [Massilia forsythiae]|uniref:Insulinase family protein n=1 Tax=Massilia forsythiae TaxID=2728020 RepID=A0A7Z2VWC7_9BURK|nr:insulinase family protein [Massilia forsythiae]QJE00456.1 insulinase family protein [Massilia forsythiae]
MPKHPSAPASPVDTLCRLSAACATCLALALPAQAQSTPAALAAPTAPAAPALTDPLPVNPALKLGKLDNGLTYYIQKNAKPAQRVELRLVVKAGSILEDDDQRGLAHFIEHMGFNGSTHFRKHELVSYLQSIGVRFGADLNAQTGFDSTIYMLPIPTDKPDNLERGFQVLEDWAHGMALGTQEIDDERSIILEEKRLRSGYGARWLEAALPKLANGARYQDRLPIGTEDSILHSRPDALRRFYADWYRPDLMAVIVVGDIDPAEAERMVRRHFSTLAMPSKPRALPLTPLPPLGAPEALVFLDREAPNSSVQLIYSLYRRRPDATVGDYRQDLVRRLFAGMMGMRMARQIQLAEPPFVQGFAGETGVPFGINQRQYAAGATVGKAGVDAAIDALVQQNQRARQFGFSESELDVAKRSVLAAYDYGYRSRDTRDSAQVLAEYIRNFLTGEAIPGSENEYGYAKAFMPGVTLEEVNAYARTVIPATAPKTVLYTSNSANAQTAPTGPALLARVDAAQTLPVEKTIDKPVVGKLMSYKPEPGAIVAQSRDEALGLTRLTLSNGVKVVLKPTGFSKDSVQMAAVRPGGQMLFPDADKTAARFAAAVQGAMGVASYSPSDLRNVLAGRNVTAGAGMSNYADFLNGRSSSEDVETLLQLNYLAMTNPRRDENLFRGFVGRSAEQVQGRAAVPEARFADARLQALYGGHPRVELQPRPADFETLNLDRTLTLFRSRMASAKGMTFFFVGDFDVEAIKPLLATYVATLPVTDLALHYRDPGIRQVPGVVRKQFKAGLEQKSIVSVDFSGDVPYSKDESTAFRVLLGVLNLRITDALREKQKLIYSGSAGGRYEMIPRGAYSLAIQLPTAPQNVEKVEAGLWAEIARLQDQGPSAEDLDKVKQALLQGYRKSMRENGYWLQTMQTAVLEGSDVHDILTLEQRVDAVTAARVQAAARRFLNRQQYVEMVLEPEA